MMIRLSLPNSKYFHEWAAGGEKREVPRASYTGRSHAHYMAPMGFEVCGVGRAGCGFKMIAWIEGQVSDDL